jgi:hypothetical protein
LLSGLAERQSESEAQLGIFQKQTGADRLSIGGALASNAHGRIEKCTLRSVYFSSAAEARPEARVLATDMSPEHTKVNKDRGWGEETTRFRVSVLVRMDSKRVF